jgi:hypothetical protein
MRQAAANIEVSINTDGFRHRKSRRGPLVQRVTCFMSHSPAVFQTKPHPLAQKGDIHRWILFVEN